jgi:hypothetical protein
VTRDPRAQAIPRYHDRDHDEHYYGSAGHTKGLLSQQQAKEIFGLTPKEFKELPYVGKQYYSIGRGNNGYSYPKHVRDCAAKALARIGSWEALAEVRSSPSRAPAHCLRHSQIYMTTRPRAPVQKSGLLKESEKSIRLGND